MKINEYQSKFDIVKAPLEKNRQEEFITIFADEFEDAYSKVSLKSPSQLKGFVDTFKRKYKEILKDTYSIEIYQEAYEKLWGYFYYHHVVDKFKDNDGKPIEKHNKRAEQIETNEDPKTEKYEPKKEVKKSEGIPLKPAVERVSRKTKLKVV